MLRPLSHASIIVAALLGLSPEARAQPGPELPTDPVLAQLIEESLARLPELAAARDRARAERERVPQAGALPDPMLELGIQNDGFRSIQIGTMETSYYSVMARQGLPWPGKRGLRREVARLEADQAETDVARVALSTEAEVRRAYLDLALARDRLELLGELEALWLKSAAVARSRYEAGEGAQSDVLRSQLELNRLRQRRAALRAEERGRQQELNRLRGRSLDEAVETPTRVRTLEPPPLRELEPSVADALARSPELAGARVAASRGASATALARRERYPDFTVSAGVMPRGQLEPMWQLGIGVNLPLFSGSKQGRAVSESEAREASTAREAEVVEQILRLRVHERRVAMQALLEALGLYNGGLLVQSRATAESTLAQYRVGKVTFASVLEANAGVILDEDGYLQALADAHRLLIAEREVALESVGGATPAAMGGGGMPGAGAMRQGGGAARSSAAGAAAGGTAPAGAASSMSGM